MQNQRVRQFFQFVIQMAQLLARESDEVLYTHAGPEIAVASTKAFATQLIAMYLIGLRN
jgi:glucosamine 6-phosphate synthetase-like amidotransferase/phosphosugar isomerase protein